MSQTTQTVAPVRTAAHILLYTRTPNNESLADFRQNALQSVVQDAANINDSERHTRERNTPAADVNTHGEKENFLTAPQSLGTIQVPGLIESHDPMRAVLSATRQQQEIDRAARNLASISIADSQRDIEFEFWRQAVCRDFVLKHWQLGDENEVFSYIPSPLDTPEQKKRRIRHFRRRMFAKIMSAGWDRVYMDPNFGYNDWHTHWYMLMHGSDEDMEARLQAVVAGFGGHHGNANAAIRSGVQGARGRQLPDDDDMPLGRRQTNVNVRQQTAPTPTVSTSAEETEREAARPERGGFRGIEDAMGGLQLGPRPRRWTRDLR
ncbi:hypothetical protein B0T16DRAFT_410848 [Cercophora newfieldiana]|uniref:Uncharacterized protein n=1 Tax=Cercophora newfieldiana TaxID=92897 RepID=A0AA39YDH3_9PEZI|nr:hypothetical protein B0T16DRAFT_410848 [Cercophora newfieldiana]